MLGCKTCANCTKTAFTRQAALKQLFYSILSQNYAKLLFLATPLVVCAMCIDASSLRIMEFLWKCRLNYVIKLKIRKSRPTKKEWTEIPYQISIEFHFSQTMKSQYFGIYRCREKNNTSQKIHYNFTFS